MTDPEQRVDCSPEGVHGRSRTRLSFEPAGEMKLYRDALRAALRKVLPQDGCGLAATYFAPDQGVVDVENVLLYNVGSGSYGHLVGGGLAVQRSRSPDALHHLDYRVQRVSTPTDAGAVIATINVPLEPSRTAGQWWSGLRPFVQPVLDGPQPARRFRLDVELHGARSGPALAAGVKPMLDGLVSALHVHDGANELAVRPRVEAALGADAWPLLVDPSAAVLGSRQLIRAHGAHGIAWNPADDLCTGFTVRPGGGVDRRLNATVRAVG